MPAPSLSTTYILAVISAVVALALTQSLITNSVAQLVTGLASTLVPLILALAHTLFHAHVQAASVAGQANVSAAKVRAGAPPVKP